MPMRVARAVLEHMDRHPRRLAVTVLIILLASWATAGWALTRTLDIGHQGRVENCRALNELIVTIYVSLGDVDAPQYIQDRFVPSQNCEDLP